MPNLPFGSILICFLLLPGLSIAQDTIIVVKTDDFIIDGYGTNPAWNGSSWINIPQQTETEEVHRTTAKVMYSEIGIYVLFNCSDRKITATFLKDFSDLWKEDVVEIFLWPDTSQSIYFEYELSPKNIELPLIMPNLNGKNFGWRPWRYSGDRKTIHQTSVQMQTNDQGASISGWIAEFFIPFKLLKPLIVEAPKEGEVWRGNLYRIDYDTGKQVRWTWQETEKHFHEFDRFGYLLFQ